MKDAQTRVYVSERRRRLTLQGKGAVRTGSISLQHRVGQD
jgi:hypothetical protein